MKKYTKRGFRNYAEFKDSYGSTITIRQSSSATENACWIFCQKPDGEDFAPHLTVVQAKRLIKGLERFIKDTRWR